MTDPVLSTRVCLGVRGPGLGVRGPGLGVGVLPSWGSCSVDRLQVRLHHLHPGMPVTTDMQKRAAVIRIFRRREKQLVTGVLGGQALLQSSCGGSVSAGLPGEMNASTCQ